MSEGSTNAPTGRINPFSDLEMEEFLWRNITETDRKMTATRDRCEELDQDEE
ncbi:hypothetical protein HAX54_032841, partial [Datura stramonium]|nr:hypothetical protein [Datura stramonium]